jgi:hypothetical protein
VQSVAGARREGVILLPLPMAHEKKFWQHGHLRAYVLRNSEGNCSIRLHDGQILNATSIERSIVLTELLSTEPGPVVLPLLPSRFNKWLNYTTSEVASPEHLVEVLEVRSAIVLASALLIH